MRKYKPNSIANRVDYQMSFTGGIGLWRIYHRHQVSLTKLFISKELADSIDDINMYLSKLPFKSWSVRHKDFPHKDMFRPLRPLKEGRSSLIICFKDKAEAAAFKMTVL